MVKTSRKLKRLIDDEERAIAKIAEWQAVLESTRESRIKEEDAEIIRCIRSLKLEPRPLYELLNGILKGTVSMEVRQQILESIVDGEMDDEGSAPKDPDAGIQPEDPDTQAPDEEENRRDKMTEREEEQNAAG